MIEGANGRRVKLDLSAVSDYAVFPGQIVSYPFHRDKCHLNWTDVSPGSRCMGRSSCMGKASAKLCFHELRRHVFTHTYTDKHTYACMFDCQ